MISPLFTQMNALIRQFFEAISSLLVDPSRRRYAAPATMEEEIDYEQAGRDVMMSRVNLGLIDIGNEHISPIWKNPRTGAILYVGNHIAAQDSEFLLNLGVTAIVNCTRPGLNGKGELPNYHESSPYNFSYYSFPVGTRTIVYDCVGLTRCIHVGGEMAINA